ncbi:hypothetical protein OXX79_013810, partial [Metschnikowia pulcherrima]
MKSQSTRGGKQNSFPATPGGPHQGYSSGVAGQRKGVVRQGHNTQTAIDSQGRLIGLLAKATGKTVTATVSSGARYKGVLSSLNIG